MVRYIKNNGYLLTHTAYNLFNYSMAKKNNVKEKTRLFKCFQSHRKKSVESPAFDLLSFTGNIKTRRTTELTTTGNWQSV